MQCNLPWQPIQTSMAGLDPRRKTPDSGEPRHRGGGGDRATIYGLVLKKHTRLACY